MKNKILLRDIKNQAENLIDDINYACNNYGFYKDYRDKINNILNAIIDHTENYLYNED